MGIIRDAVDCPVIPAVLFLAPCKCFEIQFCHVGAGSVSQKVFLYKADQTFDINAEQFLGSLAGVSAEDMKKVVIAYEPVWAIGTGKTATPEMAEEVHAGIRRLIEFRFNKEVADAVRIQYGGSMKPGNAKDLLAQADIDGGLIGGAALKVDDFMGIIEAAK